MSNFKFKAGDKVIIFVFNQVYYDCKIVDLHGIDRYDVEFSHGGCGLYPAKSIYRDTKENREVFKRYETHMQDSQNQAEIILRGLDFQF